MINIKIALIRSCTRAIMYLHVNTPFTIPLKPLIAIIRTKNGNCHFLKKISIYERGLQNYHRLY